MKKNKQQLINYMGAFFIPVLLLSIVYVLLNITPFGDSSLLTTDLNGQYTSFFAYLKRSLIGNDNLTYSFSKTISGEMIGITSYYLISPFNLIFLLFEIETFPLAITLLTLLKTGSAGVTMFYYLSKKDFSSIMNLLFSTSYAMSGYMVVYQQNIMWLDGVVLLPLIVNAVDSIFLNKNKFVYAVVLAMALITNYYIGYMICIFLVIYFISCLTEKNIINDKRDLPTNLKVFIDFCLGSIIGGGLAAFILIPSFLSLEGGKAEFDYTNIMSITSNFSVQDFISKFVIGSYSYSQLVEGLPNVYISIIVQIFSFLFFLNKKIHWGTKIKYALLLVMIYISFNGSGINLVWHAMNEPIWFPYRYSFLYPFILILMACEFFKNFVLSEIHFRLVGLVGIGLLLLVKNKEYEYLNDWKLIITFIILIGWLILISTLGKVNNKKGLVYLMFILLSSELILNSYISLKSNSYYSNSTFQSFVNSNEPIINKYRPKKEDFFRLEKNYHYSQNDPLLLGYSGLSHYSSSEKQNVIHLLGNLGYRNNGNWASYSYGSSVLSDSLMGVRYKFSKHKLTYYDFKEQIGDTYVYENTNYLPMGFITDDLKIINYQELNTFQYQNQLIKSLTGIDSILTALNTDSIVKFTSNLKGVSSTFEEFHYKKIDPDKDAYIHFKLVDIENLMVNFFFVSQLLDGAEVYLDGEFLSLHLDTLNHTVNTFKASKNEHIITLKLLGSQLKYSEELFYTHEVSAPEKIKNKVKEKEIHLIEWNPTFIKIKLPEVEDKDVLAFTIPYDKGWKVKIDGEKANVISIDNTLLGVELNKNSDIVELRYVSRGKLLGECISIIFLVIIIFRVLSLKIDRTTQSTRV